MYRLFAEIVGSGFYCIRFVLCVPLRAWTYGNQWVTREQDSSTNGSNVTADCRIHLHLVELNPSTVESSYTGKSGRQAQSCLGNSPEFWELKYAARCIPEFRHTSLPGASQSLRRPAPRTPGVSGVVSWIADALRRWPASGNPGRLLSSSADGSSPFERGSTGTDASDRPDLCISF